MGNTSPTNMTVLSVVLIAALAIVGAIFSPANIVLVIGFATSTIAALLAWGQARSNYDLTKDTHDLVNSKSQQLVEEVRKGSYAEGRLHTPPPTPEKGDRGNDGDA